HASPLDCSRADYGSCCLNNKVGNGVCNDVLQSGDEVLMLTNFSGPAPDFPPTVFPLVLEGVPASALRGQAVTATAVEYRSDASGSPGRGTRTPTAGVSVAGGGASAVTGADGTATLSLPATGTFTLQATTTHERSVPVGLCVHDAGDGGCGSTAGLGSATPPAAAADVTGPAARIAGIRAGQRFRARRAPRLLRGTVDPDPSGLAGWYLRLWRPSPR